jgi:hypothetical protein
VVKVCDVETDPAGVPEVGSPLRDAETLEIVAASAPNDWRRETIDAICPAVSDAADAVTGPSMRATVITETKAEIAFADFELLLNILFLVRS